MEATEHARRRRRRLPPLISVCASLLWLSTVVTVAATADEFPRDGTVIELDDKNFDRAISVFNRILVDLYAPWCGHCERLAPELDAAAPVLDQLDEPIVIAKINADKYRKLASKYEIEFNIMYVGLKQLGDFVDSFEVSTSSRLPKLLVWEGNKEYHIVVGSETLDDDDQSSKISRFLEGYREGKTKKKRKIGSPSFIGFVNSMISIRTPTVYLIVFVVAVLMIVQSFS